MRRAHALRAVFAGAAAWLLTSAPLAGQPAPPPPVSDTSCTYQRCSLWLDGGRLVQGAHAGLVARSGFFRPLRALPFVAGDSATHYAALYERNARRASRFGIAGFTLIVAGFIVALSSDCNAIATSFGEICQDDASGPIAAGLVLGGFTLNIVAITISSGGHRSLVRALWWHNTQYAR